MSWGAPARPPARPRPRLRSEGHSQRRVHRVAVAETAGRGARLGVLAVAASNSGKLGAAPSEGTVRKPNQFCRPVGPEGRPDLLLAPVPEDLARPLRTMGV